jgi:hypothetical protein
MLEGKPALGKSSHGQSPSLALLDWNCRLSRTMSSNVATIDSLGFTAKATICAIAPTCANWRDAKVAPCMPMS